MTDLLERAQPGVDAAARWVHASLRRVWQLLWTRRKGETWQDQLGRVGFVAVVLAGLAVAWPLARTVLAGVVLAAACSVAWVLLHPVTAPWWTHARLVDALLRARIVKDELTRLRFFGQPRTDEFGTSVKVGIPGATVSIVRAHHEELAGALRVPVGRLLVEHDPDDDPSKMTLTVLVKRRETRPAVIRSAAAADWSAPVVIGRDSKGRDVEFRTAGTHSAVVGTTGSGKSWLGRLVVSHALLDPTVRVFAIIGKDDLSDWRAMAPVCDRYVGGTGRADLPQVEDLLCAVHDVAASRKDTGAADGAIVLVVEEWYAIRAAASRGDAKLLKRLDSLMAELLATGRSRGVHVIMHVQRGTAAYLPTDVRANLGQRLVGRTADKDETRYVLDVVPDVLPAVPGEFLLGHDGRQPALVRVDVLDDDGFRGVCRRAEGLRVTNTPEVDEPAAGGEEPDVDPLLANVLRLLADGNPAGMSASELLERIDPWLRPSSAARLGAELRKYEELTTGYRNGPNGASSRVWRAVAGAVAVPLPHRGSAVAGERDSRSGDGNGNGPEAPYGGSEVLPLPPLPGAHAGGR